MKDKRFFVGMLVLILVFGLIVTGCDNGTTDEETNPFIGTWEQDTGKVISQFIVTETDWTSRYAEENESKGNYSYTENTITFISTEEWEEGHWESLVPEDQESVTFTLSEDGQTLTDEEGDYGDYTKIK
jgi:hypothetical protein